MIKCPCGKDTKKGNMFCSFECQKFYRFKDFKMLTEEKDWKKKNNKI